MTEQLEKIELAMKERESAYAEMVSGQQTVEQQLVARMQLLEAGRRDLEGGC